MTEFVTLTPSPAPTIYVKVPDDWDPLRDVWLSDFGGALAGALVAVSVALGLFLWERHERKVDSAQLRIDRAEDLRRAEERLAEERRVALGAQLSNAIDAAISALVNIESTGVMRAVGAQLIGWTSRLSDLYIDDEQHEAYAAWIKPEGKAVHLKIMHLTVELDKGQGNRDVELMSFIGSEITADLIVMEKSTNLWIKGGKWEPQLTARLEWEAEKAARAATNELPVIPDYNDIPVKDVSGRYNTRSQHDRQGPP
ncbi:hypothetical protein [Streptosporangium sp. NPDC002607]